MNSRPSPVNGSWPNARRPVGVFVAPNVLRFGRGAPSDVRVPGDGAPDADTGVDAAVAVGPEAANGVASNGPDCTVPPEPVAVLPPPTCTAPVEFDAVFVPLPPTVSGTPALAPLPERAADADGDALTELTCTLPVELFEVLPPPACTVPTEFVAVLLPEPPTATGAEAAAVVPA
jgi:hypothetical protein